MAKDRACSHVTVTATDQSGPHGAGKAASRDSPSRLLLVGSVSGSCHLPHDRYEAWRLVPARIAVGLLALVTLCGSCELTNPTSVTYPSVLWTAPGFVSGQPGADSGSIYFATTDHHLVAVRATDGTMRWRASTPSLNGGGRDGLSVLVANGVVLTGDYALYGFDAGSGARLWTFDPEIQGIPGRAPGSYAFTTDGRTVYAGSGSGQLYAVRVADGSLLWRAALASDTATSIFDPVFDSARVYALVHHFSNPSSGAVIAVDRNSGAIVWTHVFPSEAPIGSAPTETPVIIGSNVFVSNDDGRIYGFDRTTGAPTIIIPRRADVQAYNDRRPIASAGDVLVAGSSAVFLEGYSGSTGNKLWELDVGQGSPANPIGSDGSHVATAYPNGSLYFLDAASGSVRWSMRAPPSGGLFLLYPLVREGVVYAPSSSGLVAIDIGN